MLENVLQPGNWKLSENCSRWFWKSFSKKEFRIYRYTDMVYLLMYIGVGLGNIKDIFKSKLKRRILVHQPI